MLLMWLKSIAVNCVDWVNYQLTAIQEIHDLNDKHIAQIDTYELNKINEFKLTNRCSLNDDLNQIKVYCEQCKAFLNQTNITDNEVKTLNQRLKEIKLKHTLWRKKNINKANAFFSITNAVHVK